MRNFDEALRRVVGVLESSAEIRKRGVARAEAEQIMISAARAVSRLRLERVDLYGMGGEPISPGVAAKALSIAEARASGRLLQHLTGSQAFLGHEYRVTPSVLVPRPETEALVAVALATLRGRPSPPCVGLEVGLGSGVISIELLAQHSGLQMVASELSRAAIEVAGENAKAILGEKGASRLRVIRPQGALDVLDPFPEAIDAPADFLVSNPPYLSTEDEIDPEVRLHEPGEALFPAGGAGPMHFYRRIAEGGEALLRPGGYVFLEVPHQRAQSIRGEFERSGWRVVIHPDLNGRERVLVAVREYRWETRAND